MRGTSLPVQKEKKQNKDAGVLTSRLHAKLTFKYLVATVVYHEKILEVNTFDNNSRIYLANSGFNASQ